MKTLQFPLALLLAFSMVPAYGGGANAIDPSRCLDPSFQEELMARLACDQGDISSCMALGEQHDSSLPLIAGAAFGALLGNWMASRKVSLKDIVSLERHEQETTDKYARELERIRQVGGDLSKAYYKHAADENYRESDTTGSTAMTVPNQAPTDSKGEMIAAQQKFGENIKQFLAVVEDTETKVAARLKRAGMPDDIIAIARTNRLRAVMRQLNEAVDFTHEGLKQFVSETRQMSDEAAGRVNDVRINFINKMKAALADLVSRFHATIPSATPIQMSPGLQGEAAKSARIQKAIRGAVAVDAGLLIFQTLFGPTVTYLHGFKLEHPLGLSQALVASSYVHLDADGQAEVFGGALSDLFQNPKLSQRVFKGTPQLCQLIVAVNDKLKSRGNDMQPRDVRCIDNVSFNFESGGGKTTRITLTPEKGGFAIDDDVGAKFVNQVTGQPDVSRFTCKLKFVTASERWGIQDCQTADGETVTLDAQKLGRTYFHNIENCAKDPGRTECILGANFAKLAYEANKALKHCADEAATADSTEDHSIP